MEFEKVIDGILRYLDAEIYKGMNDWQQLMARIAVSRMIGNTESLKNAVVNNSYLRTFAVVDSKGMVDVDGLVKDLKEQLRTMEKVSISIPLMGTFTFTEADIDKLHSMIKERK